MYIKKGWQTALWAVTLIAWNPIVRYSGMCNYFIILYGFRWDPIKILSVAIYNMYFKFISTM